MIDLPINEMLTMQKDYRKSIGISRKLLHQKQENISYCG